MLNRSTYFVREHVGLLKLSDVYDILDPETREKIGEAREEIHGLIKLLRLFVNKKLMPATVNVYQGASEEERELVFSIRRGAALFTHRVDILNSAGEKVGYLKQKFFSLGGAFRVFTANDQEIAVVQGDWKGWNFRFLAGETEIGKITKQWAGIGKELFTSADNYVITLHGSSDPTANLLLLAAGLAVDTVLKEAK